MCKAQKTDSGGRILGEGQRTYPILTSREPVSSSNGVRAHYSCLRAGAAEPRGPGGQLTPHFFRCGVHMWMWTPHFCEDQLVHECC